MSVRVGPTVRSALIVGGSLGAAASAAVPSQMWNSVERVVVACHFNQSIASKSTRKLLCDQIVAEAASLTAYPVSLAETADLVIDPERLQRQNSQLILHIDASAAADSARPSEITLTVRPERVGLRRWKGSTSKPTVVRVEWIKGSARLKSPIAPLAFYLSNSKRGTAFFGRNASPHSGH